MNNFDLYVDKYCQKEEVPAEVAKTHAIVRSVAEYYENVNRNKIAVSEIKAGCGGAVPGGS